MTDKKRKMWLCGIWKTIIDGRADCENRILNAVLFSGILISTIALLDGVIDLYSNFHIVLAFSALLIFAILYVLSRIGLLYKQCRFLFALFIIIFFLPLVILGDSYNHPVSSIYVFPLLTAIIFFSPRNFRMRLLFFSAFILTLIILITVRLRYSHLFDNDGILFIDVDNALVYFGTLIAFMFMIQYQEWERNREQQKIVEQSSTDSLTGLMNRRFLMKELEEIFVESYRLGHPFCLIMIDLDGFKQVNDRFGHSVGDKLLYSFAQTLKKHLRIYDFSSRPGGDEFVVIMKKTELNNALRFCQRLSNAIRESSEIQQYSPITLSIGVVDNRFSSPQAVLDYADHLMYRAKKNGKNRIEVLSDEDEVCNESIPPYKVKWTGCRTSS